jgi:uncharacterized protein YjbJ (UPF0337 family)
VEFLFCHSSVVVLPVTVAEPRCSNRREVSDGQKHKHQVKGKLNETAGHVKEHVGRAVNDPEIEAEGKGQKLGGKIQKKVGQIERVFEK